MRCFARRENLAALLGRRASIAGRAALDLAFVVEHRGAGRGGRSGSRRGWVVVKHWVLHLHFAGLQQR